MPEELTDKIAEILVQMGYKNVKVEIGEVFYTELDGTEHCLTEDTKVKCEDGEMRWASRIDD